jgi:hypothetical protein
MGFTRLLVLQKLENTAFRKLDLFSSSGKGGKSPTQLGPLERANMNHWSSDWSQLLLKDLSE